MIQLLESLRLGASLSLVGFIFPMQKFASETLFDVLKKVDPLCLFGTTWQIIQATPNLGSMEILFYHLSHVLGPVIINMSMLVVPAVILLLWVNKIKDEILFQYKMLLAEIKEKPIFSLLKALCFTIPLVVIGLRFYSISTHTLYDL